MKIDQDYWNDLEAADWCPVWDGLFLDAPDKATLAEWLRKQADLIEAAETE